jgi:outer membrane protein TolC
MRRLGALLLWLPLCAGATDAPPPAPRVSDTPLSLADALATADAPNPELALAEAGLAQRQAERDEAASQRDFSLSIEGSLRRGRQPGSDWSPDNTGRIVARKPLLDFGRSANDIAAAGHAVDAERASLFGTRAARRIVLMARFFDVLLADQQYTADNEFMTVAYLAWDNARDRFELGQVSRPDLLALDARYQDLRERRDASRQRMQSARQRLADAMNQPDRLARDLVDPVLRGNAQPVPAYPLELARVLAHNPALAALDAQLKAADARIAAIRADRYPTLDAEVAGAGYSRETPARDTASAGVVFSVPLYQGDRVEARVARERAQRDALLARRELLRQTLAETVRDTLDEIELLRDSSRPAAAKQAEYRDWALERARAEYELEIKTNLGTSLAATQAALLRKKQVEYRLALALARLAALQGELPANPSP